MEQINKIKEKVMWRVHFIYKTRRILNSPLFPLVFLVVSAGALSVLVSIQHVIENTPKNFDFVRQYQFWFSAVSNTELAVKATLLVALFLLVVEVRNILGSLQVFKHSRQTLSVS
ncbi:MAG: hypothetical protein WC724_03235 [Candidatus Paceibacterota bacterium]|jgi:hypothetical protein